MWKLAIPLLIVGLMVYCCFLLASDGHRRCGSHNWSSGACDAVTHDPSGREATSVWVFWCFWTSGCLELKEPRWETQRQKHGDREIKMKRDRHRNTQSDRVRERQTQKYKERQDGERHILYTEKWETDRMREGVTDKQMDTGVLGLNSHQL